MPASTDIAALVDTYVSNAIENAVGTATAPLTSANAALTAQVADLKAKLAAATPPPVPPGPPVPSGWTVTFDEQFSGSQVDLSRWNVRNNSYANNEHSIDTSRPVNVSVANGVCSLIAQRERFTVGSTTRDYTSGYLDTVGKQSQQYGRWEARLRWQPSKGAWPAFWLRMDTLPGEIDILESVGGVNTIVQTVHQDTNGNMDKIGFEWKPPAGFAVSDWHLYALEWEAGVMRWYVDSTNTITRTTADIGHPSGQPAAWLNGPNYAGKANIRLNLQVGGSMPSYYGQDVDATTVLPASFDVDYVRVLRR